MKDLFPTPPAERYVGYLVYPDGSSPVVACKAIDYDTCMALLIAHEPARGGNVDRMVRAVTDGPPPRRRRRARA
jgi:hypothetical protein